MIRGSQAASIVTLSEFSAVRRRLRRADASIASKRTDVRATAVTIDVAGVAGHDRNGLFAGESVHIHLRTIENLIERFPKGNALEFERDAGIALLLSADLTTKIDHGVTGLKLQLLERSAQRHRALGQIDQ
jgi:hypothetical protein